MHRRSDGSSAFSGAGVSPAAMERQQREIARLARAAQGQPLAVIGVLEYWLGRDSNEGATREWE